MSAMLSYVSVKELKAVVVALRRSPKYPREEKRVAVGAVSKHGRFEGGGVGRDWILSNP